MSRKSSMPAEVHVAAICDVGLVRKRNEDYVYVNGHGVRDSWTKDRFSPDALARGMLVSVADGVGGKPGGSAASMMVSQAMGEILLGLPPGLGRVELVEQARSAAIHVNTRLLAGTGDQTIGATTYTAVFMVGNRCIYLHAGDSRLYVLRGARLQQVSRDHSLRELMGDPRIPGNIIANCFGSADEFYVDAVRLDPCDADLYLLCSDGLSDYTSHKWVERRLVRSLAGTEIGSLVRACTDLVEAAKSAGGGDNISIALIRPAYA